MGSFSPKFCLSIWPFEIFLLDKQECKLHKKSYLDATVGHKVLKCVCKIKLHNRKAMALLYLCLKMYECNEEGAVRTDEETGQRLEVIEGANHDRHADVPTKLNRGH